MATPTKKGITRKEHIQHVYELRLKNPARHTTDKAQSKADQNPDHISAQILVRGNLAPGRHIYTFQEGKLQQAYVQSYYAWNAWNYIGSGADAVRDIYKSTRFEEHHFFHPSHRPNFYQLYPTPALGTLEDADAQHKQTTDPDLRRYYRRKKSVIYVSAVLKKRTSYIGVTLPYPWEAHHLLPTNVFYKNLSMDQIRAILRTDYDINDGRNIIFLPEEPIDTPVHKLPYHSSGHVKYDKRVKFAMMKEVKDVLDKVKKEKRDHKEAAAAIESVLHELETKMFKYTRSLGNTPRQRLT